MAIVLQLISARGQEEPTPWGLFAFLGFGFILYLLVVAWWFDLGQTNPWDDVPAWKKPLDKIFAVAGIFIFFIVIVSIRQGFETLWGSSIADSIGVISEVVLIAVILIISWRRRPS